MNHEGEPYPRVVQLAGAEPAPLAQAARMNVDLGAQIIDINMGCPAKKVCGRLCGSALLQDEGLVARILAAVVRAVDVPVTLKIRTGWDATQKNAVAHCAHRAVLRHRGLGGTRSHARRFFSGRCGVRHHSRNKIGGALPLFANGDVDTPQKAREVLDFTAADGVMIGRAAQGAPWIFRSVNA